MQLMHTRACIIYYDSLCTYKIMCVCFVENKRTIIKYNYYTYYDFGKVIVCVLKRKGNVIRYTIGNFT